MDYIFEKLKIYKSITKLSYKQMATLLGVSTSQFHALVKDNANQTFRQCVYVEFNNIIEQVRHSIDESLWPELFLPRLSAARWIFWQPKQKRWETLPDTFGQPKYGQWEWTSENLVTGELMKNGQYNPALLIPKWPSKMSPVVSLMSQELDGWQKVNHMPMQTQASLIIINGRKHLLGD